MPFYSTAFLQICQFTDAKIQYAFLQYCLFTDMPFYSTAFLQCCQNTVEPIKHLKNFRVTTYLSMMFESGAPRERGAKRT